MIARLMTGDPKVSQYVGAQSFTDVAKGSWKDSAIGYCYINGIVIGVGNNKFEPDRAITDAEFITMVVRAMGYETADMKQNYPYSYMSNAQAIGLLDGTNMVASTDALRGEDAQVIYNALFTDYARGAKLVNTTHGTSVETYPTLAESVWGLNRAAVGTWNEKDDEDATLKYCKAHTWVVLGADPTADDHILAYAIDDDDNNIYDDNKDKVLYSFKYDGDASAVVGYQVELWGEGSHGEPEWQSKNDKYVWSDNWEIKAIKTVKGQKAYDYNASMADKKDDNGEIVLGEETLDLDAVASNATKVTNVYGVAQYLTEEYNNVKSINTDKEVEAVLNIRDGAQYKLMDWDSDGDIDWVVVAPANYYKVQAANSKRVTVVSMVEGTEDDFETETKSNSQTWKLDDTTTLGGVDYDFKSEETLEEGDIVEVTYSVSTDDDKELITATITKVEAETKSLDKVSTKGGLTLTFDDEEIKVAQNYEVGDTIVPANPAVYRDFNSEELGTDFALYMNRNGFIVYSDYATETANYAMVLDVADGKDKAGDRKLAKVDLLLADNSVAKDVELTSGARVQDADGEDNTDAYKDRVFDNEDLVVGNVYKYWMNEDGQITRMQAMFSADDLDQDNSEYKYKSSTDRLSRVVYDKEEYVASLEETDVIFAVKTNGEESYVRDTQDGLYVDSGDVMAVKYDSIPDINIDNNDKDETKNSKLDPEKTTKWFHADGSDSDAYGDYGVGNTFAITANGNKAGTAAILGVDNFNKFDAASTKIGLVTDVSYSNSSDGKYVEVEVATNGKCETLESKKKVDFDDIVTVKGFGDVNSESTKITGNKVFNGAAFDKYLEDNAAYAEITMDADGKVTKVSFLDTADGTAETNELKGDYYTVTRNVVTENKTKSFDYVTSTAYYASKDELYSVDRMPVDNAGIADDVAYYTIDSKPTRMDKTYKNTFATVSAGFDGTPDIEVADKASMLTASIDNRYDSDTYYVADIAFNGDGDIVAMYSFTDDMGETEDKNTILLGKFGNNDDADNSTIKAGKAPLNIDVTVPNGQALRVEEIVVKDAKGNKVTDPSVTQEGDTLKLSASENAAAGTYTAYVYGRTEGTADTVVVATFKFTVEAADLDDVEKTVDLSATYNAAEGTITVNGAGIANLDVKSYWSLKGNDGNDYSDHLTGVQRGTSNNNVVLSGNFRSSWDYNIQLDATVDGVLYRGTCTVKIQ